MRSRVLGWLRVSERPQPPPGSGPDLRIFRASRRHLGYLFLAWGLRQAGALFGLLVSLAYFAGWDVPFIPFDFEDLPENVNISFGPVDFEDLVPWIHRLELLALWTFVFQLAVSAWWLHLRWRQHWYLLGDEMMRIRQGLWLVSEQTFTISKIQNMTVHQNLLQRLLGIGDLEVHTAGGGGKPGGGGAEDDQAKLHVGWFRGMEDPWAIRDALRRRLASFSGDGLGEDGEDAETRELGDPALTSAAPSPGETSEALLVAARELLEEARKARLAFGPR